MIYASGPHDFPEHAASDDDNGSYFQKCTECGTRFTAHKHWHGPCKVCCTQLKADFDALSAEDQKAWHDKREAEINEIIAEHWGKPKAV